MTRPNPLATLVVPASPDVVRRQESVIILLNLSVLAGIAFVHLIFSGSMVTPGPAFFVVLMGRFLMQAFELVWVQGADGKPDNRTLERYTNLTIWINLGFAFSLALLAGTRDTHYAVLMMIPVIAAGFRCTPPGITLVVALSTILTFLELRPFGQAEAQADPHEYFEAASVSLTYIIVATAVALLAAQQRRDHLRLEASVAELQTTRDRLVTEEKLGAVGRLASAIAHEVRNPVAIILSALERVRAAEGDNQGRHEWCATAEQEAHRLEALTRDFLTYARQKSPERQWTSASLTVGYVADLVRPFLAQTGARLELDAPDTIAASFDPFQIHQALLNLLLNAKQATRPGGRIGLDARLDESGALRFGVENDGDAIRSDVVGHLFEPFFTTKKEGFGLGLAISRNIARSHGGDLILAANEAGRVRFELIVPATAEAAEEM